MFSLFSEFKNSQHFAKFTANGIPTTLALDSSNGSGSIGAASKGPTLRIADHPNLLYLSHGKMGGC